MNLTKINDISELYSDFIRVRTYARWHTEKQSRESWDETVDRYRDFFKPRVPKKLLKDFDRSIEAIRNKEVMPSMRALWAAGKALERDNVAGFNCSALAFDSLKRFGEMMYLLMCGAGVGFTVERQFISKLPIVEHEVLKAPTVKISVKDSRIGWAEAFNKFLSVTFNGGYAEMDYSKIRPEGAILKTFGGRASGAEPLKQLVSFTRGIINNARGRKLNSLEVHDIATYIASVVIVGGTRRSACISLSNLSDRRMAEAKNGAYWELQPQRSLANNSAVYTEKPDMAIFLEEWIGLMKSGTGERGIINREAMQAIAKESGRDPEVDYITNPCGEVVLKPQSFCNLSEIVIRPEDTLGILQDKAQYATILGILQSTLTDFRFLSKEWKDNTENDRILGVSMTGIMDHPILNLSKGTLKASRWVEDLVYIIKKTSEDWARFLGINPPTALTSIKPSGTVSQLVNTASGMHARHSKKYIRRVRVSAVDPIAQYLIDKGVPHDPEVGQDHLNPSTWVFSFPIESPKDSVVTDDMNAIKQLEIYKFYRENYTHHNPSVTVYVKDHEWLEVGAWVYKNWNAISGVSFLPYDGGIYKLAPYEEVKDLKEFSEKVDSFPEKFSFEELAEYEKADYTIGSQEYACVGGNCELT